MNTEDKARALFQFRHSLEAAGFKEDLIAEVIRKCGLYIPVFSTQLQGFYTREDGQRDAHFAVPGWYSILEVRENSVLLMKGGAKDPDVFECGTYWLASVVGANLEMMDEGYPSPDKNFNPQ